MSNTLIFTFKVVFWAYTQLKPLANYKQRRQPCLFARDTSLPALSIPCCVHRIMCSSRAALVIVPWTSPLLSARCYRVLYTMATWLLRLLDWLSAAAAHAEGLLVVHRKLQTTPAKTCDGRIIRVLVSLHELVNCMMDAAFSFRPLCPSR